MDTAPNSKNQHYVWQHYLNAWAAEGTFCCFRHKDRHLFTTQPKSVASETYFYEAHQLTEADRKFIEAIIMLDKIAVKYPSEQMKMMEAVSKATKQFNQGKTDK